MTATVTKLGPGTLTIGEVGAVVDFSCQVNNAQVEWSKDKDDDMTVLCGETVAGATTYTATLSGNLFQDIADPDGIVAFSWDHKGEAFPFEFVPNTEAGTVVSGSVVVDPITVGADEMGANMATDFDWDIVGEPAIGFGVAPVSSTGATAGSPGTWTPSGSTPPSSVANLQSGTPNVVTASPATAWTTGQYVQTGTSGSAGEAYWNATAWTAGRAT